MKQMIIPVVALLALVATAPAAWSSGSHANDQPTVAVTQWSGGLELFMEHPMLLADHADRFIIHLTVLDDFSPARDGSVELRFVGAGGENHVFATSELLREGIFAPEVALPGPTVYQLTLTCRVAGRVAEFQVPVVPVWANEADLPAAIDDAEPGAIPFLKEQQWKLPFDTAAVEVREIKRSVRAVGQVQPSPSAYVEIVAPVAGFVQTAGALPGARVEAGQVVASISPPVQGDGWASSQLAFEQAERNYERAQRLHAQDAISTRDLELARNEYLSRRAGHERVAGGSEDGLLNLTATLGGRVTDWDVRPGQYVHAGDRLMAIADPTLVWLEVRVPERELRDLGTPVGAHVKSGGPGGGWTVPAADLRVLATGGAVDPATRTVPVLLEIRNDDDRLRIGDVLPVELIASEGANAVAVPEGAVLEDAGVPVVFVQAGGESFVKRIVIPGPTHAGWTTIRDGLAPGERVVTSGGYFVKLAGTSAVIGHGHAH